MTYSAGAGGSAEYYLKKTGQRMTTYYMNGTWGTNRDGVWSGKMSERYGLEGKVDGEDLKHIFATMTLPDGTKLGQGPGKYQTTEARLEAWIAANPNALPEEVEAQRRELDKTSKAPRHAIDVTYSLPKSFTMAITSWESAAARAEAQGDTATAEAYRERVAWAEGTVWEGNRAGLGWLEGSGTLYHRAGWHQGPRGGANHYLPVTEILTASFMQDTSEDGDPHKHIHNPIINRAMGEDGQVRAIEGFGTKGGPTWTMSAIADRWIAERWIAAGISVVRRADDVASEVEFVPQDLMDQFSKRRATIKPRVQEAIDRFEESYGRAPTQAEKHDMARRITKFTRNGKAHKSLSADQLLERWRDEAQRALATGFLPLASKLHLAMRYAKEPKAVKWSKESVKSQALAAVSEKYPTWTPHLLFKEVEAAIPMGAFARLESPEDMLRVIQGLTDEVLEDQRQVVQVTGLGIEAASIEAREHYVAPNSVRFAATGTLAAEDALRAATVEQGGHSLDERAVREWLEANKDSLSPDQREAVVGIASSRAKMTQLIGPAGTGKTYTMGVLSEAWSDLAQGGRVVALAVSQNAANILADDGVEATANVAAFLAAQDRLAAGKGTEADRAMRLIARDLVVLDESSMLDERQVTRIKYYADRAGARILETGDPAQLASIGAGGVMALTAKGAEVYTLSEPRRFKNEWEGPASLRIRAGDASALNEYDRRGRIRSADSLEAAYQAAGRGVAADILTGRKSIAVLGTVEAAGQVSSIVREHLVAAGVVDEEGIELHMDRGGGTAGVGDLVMTRRNNRFINVTNRETFEVRSVDVWGGLEVVNTKTGVVRNLPARYVGEHVALAYAGTKHATQGGTFTVSRSVFDGSEDAAGVYVPLTRGAEENVAYVVTKADEEGHRPSPAAVLSAAVERQSQDVAATVARELDEARRERYDTLLDRYEDAERSAVRNRLNEHLDQLVDAGLLSEEDRAKLGADQATGHLADRIRSAEQAGHDPAEVLREAVGRGGFGPKVGSVAQTLAWRIGQKCGDTAPVAGAGRPADLLEADEARLEFLGSLMAARQAKLGPETAEAAPAWATNHLGPVPEAGTEERAAWEEKAGKVAAHREGSRWEDEERALPAAPSTFTTARRGSWQDAYDALGRPSEEREEAAMTDGRLRVRVAAWDRTLAAAPAFMDNTLRSFEQLAAECRERAALEQDEIKRKEHESEAEMWSRMGKTAEETAVTRDRWMEENRATRENATRARAVLEERGTPYGEEDDRITAEEYLGIEESGLEDEDEHRTITEADLAREQAPEASWRREEVEKAAPEREAPEVWVPPVSRKWTEQQQSDLDQYVSWTQDILEDQLSQDQYEPEAVVDVDDSYEIGGVEY